MPNTKPGSTATSQGTGNLLQRAPPQLRAYVTALQVENLRLHHAVAKLEVQALSLNHRIRALERARPDLRALGMSDAELKEEIAATGKEIERLEAATRTVPAVMKKRTTRK